MTKRLRRAFHPPLYIIAWMLIDTLHESPLSDSLPLKSTGALASGDTMIRARKLGHLVLKVRNAEASKQFYLRTLGLQVASEDKSKGMVFLSFGKEHHDLALFQMATGDQPAQCDEECLFPGSRQQPRGALL